MAFDEVGQVKIKDKETVDILRSYMASGRFSPGVEVTAKGKRKAGVTSLKLAGDKAANPLFGAVKLKVSMETFSDGTASF